MVIARGSRPTDAQLRQSCSHKGLRIGAALWRYWEGAGLLSQARVWLAAVLTRRDELPGFVRAKALWATGEITENLAEQQMLFEESLHLFRSIGDTAGIAEAVGDLGRIA